MAKTYNIREMADAFYGKNYEAIADFGARYPLVATSLAALFAKAPEEAYNFCMALPDYLTGQKLNTAFKDTFLAAVGEGIEAEDSDVEVEVIEEPKETKKAEKPAKKAKAEKVETEASDYASMSGKELYNLIKDKGLRQDYIQKMNDKKFAKPNMIAYIEKYGLEGGAEAEAEEEKPAKKTKAATKATKKEETIEEETDDLESKTPLQLYDICQKRGIKAKTRQPKEYYLGLLKEAEESEGGPEDWDDTEDVKELEKKAAKRESKPAKKAAPKKEEETEEADDDDSWDI